MSSFRIFIHLKVELRELCTFCRQNSQLFRSLKSTFLLLPWGHNAARANACRGCADKTADTLWHTVPVWQSLGRKLRLLPPPPPAHLSSLPRRTSPRSAVGARRFACASLEVPNGALVRRDQTYRHSLQQVWREKSSFESSVWFSNNIFNLRFFGDRQPLLSLFVFLEGLENLLLRDPSWVLSSAKESSFLGPHTWSS